MLKLSQEGSDNEQIALLQSLLEDANSRKNELETENRSHTRTRTHTHTHSNKHTHHIETYRGFVDVSVPLTVMQHILVWVQ